MIIDCVADLHGNYPELEGGDLLIVAGDLTATYEYEELDYFQRWLSIQDYKKKIVIAGNHDTHIERNPRWLKSENFDYLCDSGTEFVIDVPTKLQPRDRASLDVAVFDREKFKIWGSPWTAWFKGMNPKCTAFTLKTEQELAEKWAMIPDDTDILITHSPAQCIGDWVQKYEKGVIDCVGSKSLADRCAHLSKLKAHVYGHIHEGYGNRAVPAWWFSPTARSINASHVNERYKPVNKPIRIIL